MAKANPFRFSTKFQDDETDLLYYGYRYLGDGGWQSRDPVGEEAGAQNLYSACDNDVVNSFDPSGLQKFEFEIAHGNSVGGLGGITWGEPPKFFRDSSYAVGNLSATTTLIGHGPGHGYCCNTPHNAKYPNNLNAGSITVYMTDAPKGTYAITLEMKGNASIDKTEHDNEDPYSNAGATLKFSATGRGQILFGQVAGKGPRAKTSWADSKRTVIMVRVTGKSDRLEVGRYEVYMSLDTCPGVKVTAESTIDVKAHSKVR